MKGKEKTTKVKYEEKCEDNELPGVNSSVHWNDDGREARVYKSSYYEEK